MKKMEDYQENEKKFTFKPYINEISSLIGVKKLKNLLNWIYFITKEI